jgi:D-sedoheptulose 7-phosphate isomerase
LINSYLGDVSKIISEMPTEMIDDIVQTIKHAWEQGKHIMICGNGGSAALASHLACDLQKGIGGIGEKKLRAIAFTDGMPTITAWANDTDYANVFAEQVETWACPGDVLIAISASGNSMNVLKAVEAAKECGATTIGMSGFGGGKLAGMVDKSYVVASHNMQHVEDVHTVLSHLIYTCLYREMKECV